MIVWRIQVGAGGTWRGELQLLEFYFYLYFPTTDKIQALKLLVLFLDLSHREHVQVFSFFLKLGQEIPLNK